MADKEEIRNRIFWLRTACILNNHATHALQLMELEAVLHEASTNSRAEEKIMRVLKHVQNNLISKGIDWEKEVAETMGKNYYQNYNQKQPDYGF